MTSFSKIAVNKRSPMAGPGMTLALTTFVTLWRQRMRARRALSRLDAHLLRDIGLDPMTAEREATRPFWQD